MAMAGTESFRMVPWALAPSRSPHAVLGQRGAAHVVGARECQGRERGRPRQPEPTIAVSQGARAGVQATAREQGKTPRSCGAVPAAEVMDVARTHRQAAPMRVQCGGRLPHAAPRAVEASVHRQDRVACRHGGDGARQRVGHAGQRLARAVLLRQTGSPLLALGLVA